MGQGQADTAHTEGRILFRRLGEIGNGLVGAGIQGAYDQRDAGGFIKLNALRLRLGAKRRTTPPTLGQRFGSFGVAFSWFFGECGRPVNM